MSAREEPQGQPTVTLSGVNNKNKSKHAKEEFYRYSDQTSFGGSVQQAYIHLPVSVLKKLYHARVIDCAGALALLLHRQGNVRRWPAVKLPTALFNELGIDRRAASRGLQQLERAGLVRVHRKPGSRSRVTMLWHPTRELCFAPDDLMAQF